MSAALEKKYPGITSFILEGTQSGLKAYQLYADARNLYGYQGGTRSWREVVTHTVLCSGQGGIEAAKIPTDTGVGTEEDDITQLLRIMHREKRKQVMELCELIGVPPGRIRDIVEYLATHGEEIVVHDDEVRFSDDTALRGHDPTQQLGTTELVFAVMSDMHFGSTCVQITALKEFAHLCHKQGVRDVLVPGDITAGTKVYTGQEHDLYAPTAPEQEASAVAHLDPKLQYWVIGGNHDYSFITKAQGHNPLRAISGVMENFHYLGFDEAAVPLLYNVDAKLWHPSGGVPYAISYRLQKGLENEAYDELAKIASGLKERPTVKFLFAGHLHIQMQALFGGTAILGAQCGCFEGSTNYLKRKKLTPAIGGYIIKATLDKRKQFKSFDAKFYCFPEIENDYKSYSHVVHEHDVVTTPIMETGV